MEYSIHFHAKMQPILLFNTSKESILLLMSLHVVQKEIGISKKKCHHSQT